VLMWQQTLALE